MILLLAAKHTGSNIGIAHSRILREGFEEKTIVIFILYRIVHLEMEENHYNTYFYKSRPLTELGLEFRNLLFWNAPFWVLQIICIHFMLITCVWKRKCKYTFFDVYMYACVQQSAPPFHYLGLDTISAVTSMDYSYFFFAREQQ